MKDMPSVIGKANLVVFSFLPPATPVLASVHQWYAFVPSPLIELPPVPRFAIFSLRVMRPIASVTRSNSGSVALQKGSLQKPPGAD